MNFEVQEVAELVRSDIRLKILRRLQDGGRTKYELRDELDCARTTVDRNLAQLADSGWIENTDGRYRLTTSGVVVVDVLLDYVETVSIAARLQPVTRWLPSEEFDVDIRHFRDATITQGSEGAPLAMVDRHEQTLREASEVRLAVPITSRQTYETIYQGVTAGDMVAEMVVTESVARTFLDDFSDLTTELLDSDDFEAVVTDRSLSYYLGLVDGSVQIGVDEDGDPRALLECQHAAALEWASDRYESYSEQAVPLRQWDTGLAADS